MGSDKLDSKMATERAEFTIAYDGPDLTDGLMDVRDLAPALVALGGLFDRVNEIENHGRARARVSAKADFKGGSFEVLLILDISLVETVRELWTGDTLKNAEILVKLVFGTAAAGGLTGLWKLLRSKDAALADTEEIDPKAKSVTINIQGENVVIGRDILQLGRDPIVRDRAAKVVEPVARRSGIRELSVKRHGEKTFTISKTEAVQVIEATDTISRLLSQSSDVRHHRNVLFLTIVKIVFKDGSKWQFDLGDGTLIHAAITDSIFQEKIESGSEAFAKGDVLEVELKTTQELQRSGGVRTTYEIVEVLRHHRPAAGEQAVLPGVADNE